MKPNNHSRCWMLVDDDEGVLTFMREIIAQFGNIETECYPSPFQALAAFAADPKGYELVITDLEMPDMKGIEFGHRLLELEARRRKFYSLLAAVPSPKRPLSEKVFAACCANRFRSQK